jgi:hypothetical protein
MEGKLIKTEHLYCLEINEKIIATTSKSNGELEFPQRLSVENCEEIFGILNAESEFYKVQPNTLSPETEHKVKGGFIMGFDKALDLNKDKKFTYAQMLYIAGYAVGLSGRSKTDPSLDIKQEIIDAVDKMQPNELEVEVVMDRIPADLAPGGWDEFPKLDANGCLILKRI